MVRNRGVLVASFFTCVLLAVPLIVRAQRVTTGTIAAPSRAVPMRPASTAGPIGRPISVRPSRSVGVRRGVVARSSSVPERRWNGVRVSSDRSLNRTGTRTNDFANQQADDQFGSGIGSGAPVDLEQLLNISPTGGFDWQHVNAINQDLPLKAIVDPVTRLEISQAEHLLKIGGGQFSGAYILGGGGSYYVPEGTGEEQAPPAAEEAAPESQPTETAQPRVIVLQQKTSETQESTPPILANEGNFTLILRNGQKIDAIAFTRVNGTIVYITPDGDRKTIDAAELDSAATMRVNQEHGTPLQLSGS